RSPTRSATSPFPSRCGSSLPPAATTRLEQSALPPFAKARRAIDNAIFERAPTLPAAGGVLGSRFPPALSGLGDGVQRRAGTYSHYPRRHEACSFRGHDGTS